MSSPTSTKLNTHFKKQSRKLSHLEYLDQILWSIHPVHFEKVISMRKDIELALLNNPESKTEVVAYLSWVHKKIQNIENQHNQQIHNEIQTAVAA